MHEYLNTANKIIDFLYNNQVISGDHKLLFKRQGKVYFSEFRSRFIRKDPKEYVIPLYLVSKAEEFYLTNSAEAEKIGIFEGCIFRINPKGISHGISPDVDIPISIKRSFIRKGKEIGYKNLVKRIYWSIKNNYRKYSYLDYAFKYALGKHLHSTPHSKKRLEESPGFSFIFEKAEMVSEGVLVSLESYDLGGIFDDNLNSEGKYYPPQVAGNYYADAYAAWCFLERYIRGKDKKFLDAGVLALDFIKRIYPHYQAANIVWHHSDFKNPVIIETICEVLPKVAPERTDYYRGLLKQLKEDNYEPTNIYALRLHTYALERRHHIKKNLFNRWIALNRLRKDQTKYGLIRDVLPRYHEDARDLTYHQYMMACIARSLSREYDRHLMKIFVKGVRFSLSLLTPDGEVAYLGRCANNVYHSTSAIFAFEFASGLKGISKKERGQYKRAAKLILSYIKPWQRAEGDFPTALNDQFANRMGWSHCRTPYNALSAYFLSHAALVRQKKLTEYPVPMDAENGVYFRHFEESGYVAYSNKNYYVVLFSGGKPSYWWSQGAHRSGLSGIAILGKPGAGSITGALNESNDIQDNIPNDIFGRKQIKIRSKEVGFYKDNEIYQKYRFLDDRIDFFAKENCNNLFLLKPAGILKKEKTNFHQLVNFVEDNKTKHKFKKRCEGPNPSGLVELWQYK